MYSTENYIWGLVAYVLGVALLIPFLWWATRAIAWHPVKAFFRIFALVFLLTPAFPYPGMDYLAPAWVVSLFEIVKPQTEEGIWRGLLPIGLCFVLIYTLEFILWLSLRRRSKRSRLKSQSAGSEPDNTLVRGSGAT